MNKSEVRRKYLTEAKALKSVTGSPTEAPTNIREDSQTEIESDSEKLAKPETESKSRTDETKTYTDSETDTDTETQANTGTGTKSTTDGTQSCSDSESQIEEQSDSKPSSSSQAKLPLSQQETVDPTDWEEKYKSWSDVGTGLTKKWPKDMGLEPTEYRFAAKHGISLGKKLGSGAQGSVWKANVKDHKLGVSVEKAVKVLNIFDFKKGKRDLKKSLKAMLREADNVYGLKHPNMVTPEAIFNIHDEKTRFPYCRVLLVMELCDGDLDSVIESEGHLSETTTRTVMAQVCAGLKFLHDNRVAHLDIKPSNILYIGSDNERQYKLSDFGLSYKFAPKETIVKIIGTYHYRAPELDGKREADPSKADIYSLGMTMLTMLVGKERFKQLSTDLSSKSTKKHKLSLEVVKLGQAMIKNKYKNRPDIDTIIADQWFKS